VEGVSEVYGGVREETSWSFLSAHLQHHCSKDYTNEPDPAKAAFIAFGNHLGRVRSFRALALYPNQHENIERFNSIFPSGRLTTTAATIDEIVNTKGIFHIAYARLYIGLRLLDHDPSLSLHDDGETAVCIASGYMKLPEKPIYLMEMDVPKVFAITTWPPIFIPHRSFPRLNRLVTE